MIPSVDGRACLLDPDPQVAGGFDSQRVEAYLLLLNLDYPQGDWKCPEHRAKRHENVYWLLNSGPLRIPKIDPGVQRHGQEHRR
jgi:hypothetical protein